MNVEIIAECERCRSKKLIGLKDIENTGIRDLIKNYTSYQYTSIFGKWIIVCPMCVEAYAKITEKRGIEASAFMEMA